MRARVAAGGAIAGALAGIAIALVVVIVRAAIGSNTYVIIEDHTVLTAYALASLACGLIFGLFAYGLSNSATVLVGPLFGYVVWIVRGAPRGVAVFAFLGFGLALGLAFLLFQRPSTGEVPCTSFEGPSARRRSSTIASSISRVRTSAGSRS